MSDLVLPIPGAGDPATQLDFTRRIHECSICKGIGNWGPTWSYFGTHDEASSVYCSDDCRRKLAPGSEEASAFGCTCPVIDNGHGRRTDRHVFNADCPLHGCGRDGEGDSAAEVRDCSMFAPIQERQ